MNIRTLSRSQLIVSISAIICILLVALFLVTRHPKINAQRVVAKSQNSVVEFLGFTIGALAEARPKDAPSGAPAKPVVVLGGGAGSLALKLRCHFLTMGAQRELAWKNIKANYGNTEFITTAIAIPDDEAALQDEAFLYNVFTNKTSKDPESAPYTSDTFTPSSGSFYLVVLLRPPNNNVSLPPNQSITFTIEGFYDHPKFFVTGTLPAWR